MAERDGAGWRTITYAQTLEKIRRIGAALLTRNLSEERPIVILSGNDLEHALLGLAANYVGVPYAPISPAYSLISSDFGKLTHIIKLLTPGLVYASNAQYQCRSGRRLSSARSTSSPLRRTMPMPRMRTSRPTRSRNSCSPPAPPACRRA
jgi:feruloyl-CoA synthase